MADGIMEAVWAFSWGMVPASGVLLGVVLGLTAHLRHRGVAAIMSVGAGVLLSLASIKVASEAVMLAGAALTVGGIIFGAATFSIANAALVTAKDRKRWGECKPQPSETEAPGSGTSLALGTALDGGILQGRACVLSNGSRIYATCPTILRKSCGTSAGSAGGCYLGGRSIRKS